MDPDFKVKVQAFEGPLDVLLSLIEKKKMHISDVSLAAITDDYIAYINEHGAHSMADAADFILVAATLMLIKSIALLPGLVITPEEQASIEELEEKLRKLERIRSLGHHIDERYGRVRLFERVPAQHNIPIFAPPKKGLDLEALLAAARRTLSAIQVKPKLPQASVRAIVRLEDVIQNLMERVTRSIRMSFREFASGDKMNIIVSFLAVLELVKQGSLGAAQETHFSEIHLESLRIETPRYD